MCDRWEPRIFSLLRLRVSPSTSTRSPIAVGETRGGKADYRALVELGRSRLGAILGVLAILHTWTQLLEFHPHVHCIIPGGGFSRDGKRWVRLRRTDFLIATTVLSRRFRSIVTTEIRHAFCAGKLSLPPSIPDRTALGLVLVAVGLVVSQTSGFHVLPPGQGGQPATQASSRTRSGWRG